MAKRKSTAPARAESAGKKSAARFPGPDVGVLVQTLDNVVSRAHRDYRQSMKARKRDWDEGRKLAHGMVNGVMRHAHGWCVDFIGTPLELVAVGLALPEWFAGSPVCRRVCFDERMIELYRPEGEKYELSIPYNRGSIEMARS